MVLKGVFMRRRVLVFLPALAVCLGVLIASGFPGVVCAQNPPPTVLRFAPDSAVLTVEEKASIAAVAKYWKRENVTSLKLIGHADGALGDAGALTLSEKRAKAVKAELIQNGIREQYISAYWRGQTDPRVQAQVTDRNIVEVIFIW